MYRPLLLVPGLSLTLCACASRLTQPMEAYNPPLRSPDTAPMIRVGLLSDAQLQTLNAPGQLELWRRTLDDVLVNVALRPAASDKASGYMMETALRGLSGVDLILYSGDAANNGCADELAGAFQILRRFRAESAIPIYFAIGNHDYLGAGNTSDPAQRQSLCGPGNLPATKLDVIRIAQQFNRENSALARAAPWTYSDNYSTATDKACLDTVTGKRMFDYDQHMKTGCYYAAVLALGDSVQILILDTSDYADVSTPPTYGRELTSMEFGGIRGAVSFQGAASQGEWLKSRLAGRPVPRVRVIASHYNLSGLRWSMKGFGSRLVGWPADYLDPVPPLGNRWLYGHTHTKRPEVDAYDPPLRFCADGDCTYLHEEINVGSTTDWSPHALIAAIGRERSSITPIWIARDCEPLEKNILDEARNAAAGYRPVNGKQAGTILFGIDRSYRNYSSRSSAEDRKTAYSNLDLLVGRMAAATGRARSDVWTCVGAIASEFEKSGKSLKQ